MTRRAAEFVAHQPGLPGLRTVAAHSAHSFPRHSHDEFGIGVMLAGGQISASGRGQVEAIAGDVITVNPGEVHDGMPLRGERRSWRMLYLSPQRFASLLDGVDPEGTQNFEFEHPVFARHAVLRSRLLACLDRLCGPDRGDGFPAEEALLPLFAPLLLPASRAEAGNRLRLQRARDMIEAGDGAAPSLGELARETGMSRFQLLRAFAAWTGLTPHAYAMQKRADRARRLIAGGSTLVEAATVAGYADQSHMTRDFRRRWGLTPASFSARR
ncbi:helix-turn-helix transcriptional regulator [Rhizobium halophytocola]|uniref:AraC-like DNA-binding protein n=1 Tax=Rhizobium halophytocola TaxID=735519 RepID=A0ABS4E3R9_9HYPH|nr:AraC family transcriptional regulator [Rhizobium halophytocola]MBP1852597.1 AraC-like DNA-binding protein [Rhizobium halophytocola]